MVCAVNTLWASALAGVRGAWDPARLTGLPEPSWVSSTSSLCCFPSRQTKPGI